MSRSAARARRLLPQAIGRLYCRRKAVATAAGRPSFAPFVQRLRRPHPHCSTETRRRDSVLEEVESPFMPRPRKCLSRRSAGWLDRLARCDPCVGGGRPQEKRVEPQRDAPIISAATDHRRQHHAKRQSQVPGLRAVRIGQRQREPARCKRASGASGSPSRANCRRASGGRSDPDRDGSGDGRSRP